LEPPSGSEGIVVGDGVGVIRGLETRRVIAGPKGG